METAGAVSVRLRRHAERSDLDDLAEALQTPSGIRRRRRQLDEATQIEYRTAGCKMRNFKTRAAGVSGSVSITTANGIPTVVSSTVSFRGGSVAR